MAITSIYNTIALVRNITNVVRMSKDCRSELAIFLAQGSLSGGGAISTINFLLFCALLIDPLWLAILVLGYFIANLMNLENVKYFVVFSHLKVKPVFYYMYINHLSMPHDDVTNNDSTKVIFCSEQPSNFKILQVVCLY